MFRKMFLIPLTTLMILMLSACASVQLPWAAASTVQSSASQQVKYKLAVGILKLEDTQLSINSTQAKDLLFLWKGIKSLSPENNTSPLEIAAIYDQMQEVLNAQQVQAIKDMQITAEDLDALMQKYGIVGTSPTVKKTAASSNAGGPGGGMMGPPPGGGDIMMGPPPDSASSGTKTASSARSGSNSSQVNYNLLFADSLIKLLKQKAGNS